MSTNQPNHCAQLVTWRTLVIIPTYNELENLPRVVRRVRKANRGVDILIVDDNSPDGTGGLADAFAAVDDHVHVLHRPGKGGLGAAYLAGFSWGLEAGYDVLVEMDADGSHQPEQLPRLLERISGGSRFVTGSRWVEGGAVENWPLHRKLISRGGSLYARLMLGTSVRDITGGFRAIRADVLRDLDLAGIESAGYCFQVDLAWRALQQGISIDEVPITFIEREYGESKMSSGIVFEALARVTAWGIKHRLDTLRGARLIGARA